MKNPSMQSSRAAFTLIELLVVISIIAVLAALAIPATTGVMVSARKAQARNDMLQIANAVKMYYTEYSRYPIDNETVTSDLTAVFGMNATNNSAIINVLRYASIASDTQKSLNPRQIKFIEPKVANYSKACVNIDNGNWFDPWGTQYIIFIDADYASDIDASAAFSDITVKPSVSVGVASVGYYYVKRKQSPPATLSAAKTFDKNTDLISWQ